MALPGRQGVDFEAMKRSREFAGSTPEPTLQNQIRTTLSRVQNVLSFSSKRCRRCAVVLLVCYPIFGTDTCSLPGPEYVVETGRLRPASIRAEIAKMHGTAKMALFINLYNSLLLHGSVAVPPGRTTVRPMSHAY
eukprot:3778761-Rhodomonas_salina.1